MSMEEIRQSFPLLTLENHQQTSDSDFNYNCLAFALGDTQNWWDPPAQFGIYWPLGFSPDHTVETAKQIIRLSGYTVEVEKDSNPHTDAVAIYADGDEWTHFAKFTGGQWFSKLGEDHDISHLSLDLLEGDLYGKVVQILSRPLK
jgi:hypothetical protein